MSDLVYQNYNNRCQGWVNPSNLFFGPEIISLTGYQSPAGSNTVVSIIGSNFFSYSIIRFGTFTPTVYFINSTLLSFYIPNTLNSGTYPVQVCNGSTCSNIVNYTIDNASGYWMLNSGGNTNTITNTNPNGVQISWLSRGAPYIINDGEYNTPATAYQIPNNVNWIICNSNSVIYVELPSGIQYVGREITFKKTNPNGPISGNLGEVFSTTSTVSLLQDSPIYFGNEILLAGSGNWATLVYNGNFWFIMQGNAPPII